MTSHTSHVGHAGNTSHVGHTGGGGGGAGAMYFADRVDLPFVTLPGLAAGRLHHRRRFGRHMDATYTAWGLLAAFADKPRWQNRQKRAANGAVVAATGAGDLAGLSVEPWWKKLVPAIDKVSVEALSDVEKGQVDTAVNAEFANLLLAAETERADAMGEILTQASNFIPDFMGLLGANAGSHPATYKLLFGSTLIAGFAVQHFKNLFDRARPSHVCPALKPPIEVPGHSSYPSGHATQATLIALLLGGIFTGDRAGAMPAINALAARVARNREIAGLHYNSDTVAGNQLAADLHAVLLTMDEFVAPNDVMTVGPAGKGLIERAKEEWA
jgi:hypothetical protein